MRFRSKESFPGQHRLMAAKELVGRLNAGPMYVVGQNPREWAWCEEEAIKIINEALTEWEEELARVANLEKK